MSFFKNLFGKNKNTTSTPKKGKPAIKPTAAQTIEDLDRKKVEWLKKLTLSELERKVYRYDGEYFRFIGEENESVREFRKAIEDKDILTLYNKWQSSFVGSFLSLERKAGHKSRPMLMDYYYGYELEIKELYERKKSAP
jgi:hypothetical protein